MKIVVGFICILLSFQATAQVKGFCYSAPLQKTRFYNSRTAGLNDGYHYWDTGRPLYIRFLNGSEKLRLQIMAIALQWTKYANIKFVFRNEGESHIRINLNSNYLNASVGTVANIYPQDEPNVHIDTSGFSDKKLMNGIVLHAFGHVLGLEHENVVPVAGRKWNMQQIDPENKWDEAKIMIDYIEPYSVSRSNNLVADRRSVMYQSFPLAWINEKPQVINQNFSSNDTLLISNLYPFKVTKEETYQYFAVKNYQQTKVTSNEWGFCFYPQMEIETKDWKHIQVSVLLYDLEGNPISDEYRRYTLDDQLATTKAVLMLPNKTIIINKTANDFGLFLPFSEIPATYKGKQLMAMLRVYIPDNAKENASKDFNSKPFLVSVPK